MHRDLRFRFFSRTTLTVFVALTLLVAGIVFNTGCREAAQSLPELKPSQQRPSELYVPEEGFVPDEATAKRIAEAIWLPIYGEEIKEEKPYQAELVGDSVWAVSGSPDSKGGLGNVLGGVAYIEIRKADGAILGVSYGE